MEAQVPVEPMGSMLFKGTDVHLHVAGAELRPIAVIAEIARHRRHRKNLPQITQMGADQERPGGSGHRGIGTPKKARNLLRIN
jgi:hypothetical protein